MSLAVLRSRALAGMAKDRVRAALQNAGFEFLQRRITFNMAPADLPKESG